MLYLLEQELWTYFSINYPWGALILFDHEGFSGFAKETFYNFIVNQEKEKHNERYQEILKNVKRN